MIYNSSSSNALTSSENKDSWRKINDLEKSNISSKYIVKGPILEIGCGTGQILSKIKSKSLKVGLDYSSARLESSIYKNKIFFIKSDVKKMPFINQSFNNIVMSHFFHELIQFEDTKKFHTIFSEIKSKLKPNGRMIILDHCDPGNGFCRFEMTDKNLLLYKKFKSKFRFFKNHKNEKGNMYHKKNLQNFITKIWSLNTAAEKLEMNEDHTILDPQKIYKRLKKYGLELIKIDKFGNLEHLSKFYKLSKKRSNLFKRQFCLIMKKI